MSGIARVPDPPTMDLELRKVGTTLYNFEECHAALPFELQVQCPDTGERNKDSGALEEKRGSVEVTGEEVVGNSLKS